MATLRLSRSLNACANGLTHTFTTSSLKAQASISSTIFKATITFTTCRAIRPQQSPFPISQPIQRLEPRQTYASASPASPIQSQNATSALNPADILTWDQFLATRRRRRFVNTGVSIVCAIAAAIFGSPLIGEFDIDTKVSQATGIDPLGVIAAGSLVVAITGWFAGRVLSGVLFSLWARRGGRSIVFAEKEKSFFDRIKRYRADPSSSSPQNPIPDYYGEKIGSVKDYRRWLKDQRAFTKKMYRGVR